MTLRPKKIVNLCGVTDCLGMVAIKQKSPAVKQGSLNGAAQAIRLGALRVCHRGGERRCVAREVAFR